MTAAALCVQIPQKTVLPQGLSGHVPSLAKTANATLFQISDSSLIRLANLGINDLKSALRMCRVWQDVGLSVQSPS